MTDARDPRQPLEAAIAALQSRRAALGDALVDAALAPLLEGLAALGPALAPAATGRRLRQVSVLFLDLVGSTTLIRRLDPEEVQATVDGALAAFTAIVRQHGGEVLRYAGDNLKAAFGAHDTAGTREDDAERAVQCGLALLAEAARWAQTVRRRHGHEGFNARVGIHTGTVVRGGGIENDKSLSGLSVHIAARLEQAAPAGALCISQDTWALVRGLFDAQAQPPLQVKGVDAPIASWLVQGPKPRASRLHARGVRGQETPLVGRQAELARFGALLESLRADGQPRALTVIADAGLGKSRLLNECQHLLAAHGSRWSPMPARIQPSGLLQPYGLLRDLLSRRLAIADSDAAELARAKLVQGLSPWLDRPGDPAPELLGHLIGLDFSDTPAVQRLGGDARLLRDRAVTALRLWLERLAERDGTPAVLLLDDLHWADDASLDALVVLLEAARGPLLTLVFARPGLIERWPDWGARLPRHERLTLQPLDAAQGSALTRSLLQRLNPLPAELAGLVDRRAEGNPFYAEELVGMLLDRGTIEIDADGDWHFHADRLDPQRLPTTLTGVLQARLDALPPEARQALQMASVIGPVFWDDALGALDARGPEALPTLQRKSLVQPRPTSAFEDTTEEAFQHHLLHQVSYDTVLKPQKREGHARAAAWLTQRVGDRGDETLGITAEHWARAGEPGLAAEWFLRAAIRAEGRYAYKASLQYIERAEAQAALHDQPWPPGRQAEMLDLLVRLADHLVLRDRQAQAIEDLLALGEAHGMLPWIAKALQAQTLLAFSTGQLALAEAAGRRGAEVAEGIDDARSVALCRGNLAYMAIERRDFDRARQELATAMHWAARARQRMERRTDGIYEVQLLLVESELHAALNDDRAQEAALERALAIAGTAAQPRLECVCLDAVAHRALSCADLRAAAGHIDAMARQAAEFGLHHSAAMAQQLRARLHLQAAAWAEAERAAIAAGDSYRAASDVVNALRCRNLQAEALWRGGDAAAAAAIWQETGTALQQRGDDAGARALRLRLAEARAAAGPADSIEVARQAVRAELTALQDRDALAGADFPLAARLSAWRVLERAGDPAAAGQRALAAAELAQVLDGFGDPAVQERVRTTVPWHREVAEALARTAAA